MKILSKLSINCVPQLSAALLEAIAETVHPDWGISIETGRDGPIDPSIARFDVICPASITPYPTFISFGRTGPTRVEVVGINDTLQTRLTIEQYNLVLRIVRDRILKPAADKLGLQVAMTGDQAVPTDWFSPKVALALHTFSSGADKGLGGADPRDRRRWLDFILAAHQEHARIDPALLRRWLIEDENWFDEHADHLAAEYDFGLSLLEEAAGRIGAA